MKKILTSAEQINKLQEATLLAKEASKSTEIAARLGAFVLIAGILDFSVIQAARLVEQIILKGQLSEGKAPTFQPSPDAYFYDHKISTSGLLKGIRKLLPFSSSDQSKVHEVKTINEWVNKTIDIGYQFLDCRNPIIHHIGNPNKKLRDLITLCDQANLKYERFCEAHRQFMEAALPYRFGEKELEYFYGKSNS